MSFNSYPLFKMLSEHGENLTLHKKTSKGTYNPSTGKIENSATTDYIVLGYFHNYTDSLDNNLIMGKRKCLISTINLAAIPEEGDFLSGVGSKVVVKGVDKVLSSEGVSAYICHVEG